MTKEDEKAIKESIARYRKALASLTVALKLALLQRADCKKACELDPENKKYAENLAEAESLVADYQAKIDRCNRILKGR